MDTFGGSHGENCPLAPILRERLVGTSPTGNGRRTTQSSRMSRSGWLCWMGSLRIHHQFYIWFGRMGWFTGFHWYRLGILYCTISEHTLRGLMQRKLAYFFTVCVSNLLIFLLVCAGGDQARGEGCVKGGGDPVGSVV